ncbi:MAG: hypothetical protein JPMHGGIA_02306 [Saprospiraceae bacterium]|jgi:hypothetical protein|nr:hypothetical protein [Saprospiraceae bacterium]
MRILFFIATTLATGIAVAQTTDEILEKHLSALGGCDKLKSIQTLVIEGKVSADGMEIPVTMTIVHNRGMRMEYTVMGMDAWNVIRPDSGWTFMPFTGQTKPEPMPVDMIQQSQDQLDLSGQLCDLTAKGNAVEFLGMEDVEGTDCYKLKCLNPQGKLTYYLIDPQTNYLVKAVSKIKAEGREIDTEISFGDYRKVEGDFVFAHSYESGNGPMTVTRILVNSPVAPEKLLLNSY